MNVIVVGMGRMGVNLARKLDRQGYSVCAIDQDPERLESLGESFGGSTVEGVGFDRAVLEAAGIDRASAVIACTSSDETNIVVARISRQTYRVPRVIARLYEISNAETYRRLGIQSISTTDWLTVVGEISIVAVSHDNETFVPTQGTVLDHGDIIYAAVASSAAGKFRTMLGLAE